MRGIVTESLRIGHDDEDRAIRLGDRFERLLKLLQPDGLVDGGTKLRELWLLSVTDVDLRNLARLKDLQLLFCEKASVAFHDDFEPPSASDSPCLPLLRTLVLAETPFEAEQDDRIPPIFPHHQFPTLEILSFDEFDAFSAVFGCDSWALPKLRAFQPGCDTPAALCASADQPATPLNDMKRDPNDDFLQEHGLRCDTLLCLHLSADTLPDFPSFGSLLSENLVKIVIEDAVEDLEREDLEAFITSPHFRRLLAEPSSANLVDDKLIRGVTRIKTCSGTFRKDLRDKWPDLDDRLEDVLKDRAVRWSDREYPDFGEYDDAVLPIIQIAFLHDAECVIRLRTKELSGSGLAKRIGERDYAMKFSEAQRHRFEAHNVMCVLNGHPEDIEETFQPCSISIPQYTFEDTLNPDWRPPRVEDY
ncbi:hypothetical protein JCM10021v2_001635 [Rhodotorula toruloides]|nr:Proteophosphoglycan ppg4 [Rhodotorula toruloides]